MALIDSITKMRRFLRDPDGQIWSDEDLRLWFNECQFEIVQKINFLERIEAHYYPPYYNWSYLHDWEAEFVQGDSYQALISNQAGGNVVSYPWESAYWMDHCDTPDDGYRLTNPWEIGYAVSAETMPIKLHHEFHKMKYAAYDESQIYPMDQAELEAQDRFYKTRTGLVTSYYRPDEEGNSLIPYPRPGTFVFQVPDYTEWLDDTGGILAYDESVLQESETGIATDVISSADAFFFIYESLPVECESLMDVPDIPPWLIRVVEYGTLERAFAADTDGFIPSLRDYWRGRKEISIAALRKLKRQRVTDRYFRLGITHGKPINQHPTLGEHYPRQCP